MWKRLSSGRGRAFISQQSKKPAPGSALKRIACVGSAHLGPSEPRHCSCVRAVSGRIWWVPIRPQFGFCHERPPPRSPRFPSRVRTPATPALRWGRGSRGGAMHVTRPRPPAVAPSSPATGGVTGQRRDLALVWRVGERGSARRAGGGGNARRAWGPERPPPGLCAGALV